MFVSVFLNQKSIENTSHRPKEWLVLKCSN